MPEYRRLDQIEEGDRIESEKLHDLSIFQWPVFCRLLIIIHIIVFGIYVMGLVYVLNRQPLNKECDYKYSTHSPALPIVTYESPKHLDAEVVQTNKYRGYPTPEIDAEWLKVGLEPPAIRLFEEDLIRLNKTDTPGRPLHRIPEEYGGGYLAMLEVFHLLHCLNSLRKAMDKEYYAEEWSRVGESAMRAHNEHCIDMLRITIMCTSDVTPITFYDNVLLPERKLPMPDFDTLHTCRNFDEILEWNANNERTLQWDEIGLDIGDR